MVAVLTAGYTCRAQEAKDTQVDLVQRNATLLETITAVGLQTHVPIGVVLGGKDDVLCKTRRSFSFKDTPPRSALEQAASLVNYSVEERNGVLLLTAPDVTAHQRQWLTHRFERFPAEARTMHLLSADLSGWLWSEVDHGGSWGTSIGDSAQAYKIDLPLLENMTTEEIADRVVTTGPGGMWILHATPGVPHGFEDDRIDFYSWSEPIQVRSEASCR
jgi:hypothetical protein